MADPKSTLPFLSDRTYIEFCVEMCQWKRLHFPDSFAGRMVM